MKNKLIIYLILIGLGQATIAFTQNDPTSDSWESITNQVKTNETVRINNALIMEGTASPRGIRRLTQGYNLDLWGGNALRNGASISLSGDARGGANSINNGRLELWTGGDFMEAQADIKGDMIFGTRWLDDDKTLMTLKSSNGRLGVGTSNPSAIVHIQRSSAGYAPGESGLKVEGVYNTYVASITNNSGGNNAGGLYIKTSDGNGLTNAVKIDTRLTTVFRIPNQGGGFTNRVLLLENGGNVGIGTTTPEHELDICGFARAKEIIVETGWCDYVFEKEYPLPSLKEQKDFITKNGHLKNFESEKEMAGQLQVGDIQKRQQQTIEEMMLYMIEMEERLSKLEEENKNLKLKQQVATFKQ